MHNVKRKMEEDVYIVIVGLCSTIYLLIFFLLVLTINVCTMFVDSGKLEDVKVRYFFVIFRLVAQFLFLGLLFNIQGYGK